MIGLVSFLAEMLFNAPSDMEHGGEPAVLSQLLQDEDVSYRRARPHEFWSGAQCLQLPVSDSRCSVLDG